MYNLSVKLDKSNEVYLYTSDNDLLQSLSDNVRIIKKWDSTGKREEVTLDNYYENEKLFKKFGGTDPNKLPFFRALRGDTSDNIKGIYRLPTKVAALIANNINSPLEYKNVLTKFSNAVTKTQLKYLVQIEQEADRIIGNYHIMKLYNDIDMEVFREIEPIGDLLTLYKLDRYKQWLTNHHIPINL